MSSSCDSLSSRRTCQLTVSSVSQLAPDVQRTVGPLPPPPSEEESEEVAEVAFVRAAGRSHRLAAGSSWLPGPVRLVLPAMVQATWELRGRGSPLSIDGLQYVLEPLDGHGASLCRGSPGRPYRLVVLVVAPVVLG